MIKSKWTVNNLTEPQVSGYKLLSKRTLIEILKNIRFKNEESNFPWKFWCGKDATVSNSSVPFIILLLFSLRLAGWVNRVKTTRFCTCFVHEYNFHTYCITKKYKRDIRINRNRIHDICYQIFLSALYATGNSYLINLKILCILAQRAHYKCETRFSGARIIIFVNLFMIHARRTKSKSCQTDVEQNEQIFF